MPCSLRVVARTTALVVACTACGASLELNHASQVRFEHCYRLDMDDRIAGPHREHCWKEWTETYAYDQPLDRIEYARRRIVALEAGDHRLVAVRTGTQEEGRVFAEVTPDPDAPMAAPAPTSAHAPPPSTEPTPSATVTTAAAAPPLPAGACATACESTLAECSRLCAAKPATCAACPEDYRLCMRRCFE